MSKRKIIIEAIDLAYKLQNAEEYLFKDLNFSISDIDRIGLIGINGSGKSTLLKIVANILSPTEGRINTHGHVEYVPQLDLEKLQSNQILLEYLETNNILYWKIQSLLNEIFSWEIDLYKPLDSFSGGQLMKIKICIALSSAPQLLLLDEPTNHMDLDSIKILEKLISNFNGGVVSISHNKSFLNNTSNQTWELDNNEKTINNYGGNYSLYIEHKKTQLEANKRQYEVALKKKKKLVNIKDKMQERMAKREKSGKKKLENRRILKSEFNMMKSNAEYGYGKEKVKIDKRMDLANELLEEKKLNKRKMPNINFKINDKDRKTMLSLQEYSVTVENKALLGKINLNIENGDRICISGANGSGKTILVKSIIGDYEYIHSTGKKYLNPKTNPIYLDQKYEIVDPQLSLLDNLLSANKSISEDYAKAQLGKLQFDAKTDFTKPAYTLSGGETAKLALAMVTVSASELVILDEPVNNLDIETINIFEQALNNYNGAIIVISHDESFIENIKIERNFKIRNRSLKIAN